MTASQFRLACVAAVLLIALAPGVLSPFSITLQPSAAKAWATARPIPLVDPVTSAALPSSDIETHFLKNEAAAEA